MAERLSADTVCSKDCSSGLADSVVASGRLGVELAFLLLETRADDRTPPVEVLLADADADDVVSVFCVGDVKTDLECCGGDVTTTGKPLK